MRLAVSSWQPYQHQADALQQLLGEPVLARERLEDVGNPLLLASVGPFIALVDDSFAIPVMGLSSIVEALDRLYPERALLPLDAVARAQARALAQIIEQHFSYVAMAAIGDHDRFDRSIWPASSTAPARVLETPGLVPLEVLQAGKTSRFFVGERPSLADCMMAALWWSAQDQGIGGSYEDKPWLARWYERNCFGSPFSRSCFPAGKALASRQIECAP